MAPCGQGHRLGNPLIPLKYSHFSRYLSPRRSLHETDDEKMKTLENAILRLTELE